MLDTNDVELGRMSLDFNTSSQLFNGDSLLDIGDTTGSSRFVSNLLTSPSGFRTASAAAASKSSNVTSSDDTGQRTASTALE